MLRHTCIFVVAYEDVCKNVKSNVKEEETLFHPFQLLVMMTKIERLNIRVEKLLFKAVNEVLEAVKETVTEFQEKTVRTQRENLSLKKRLQELQERCKSPINGKEILGYSYLCLKKRLDKLNLPFLTFVLQLQRLIQSHISMRRNQKKRTTPLLWTAQLTVKSLYPPHISPPKLQQDWI